MKKNNNKNPKRINYSVLISYILHISPPFHLLWINSRKKIEAKNNLNNINNLIYFYKTQEKLSNNERFSGSTNNNFFFQIIIVFKKTDILQ